MRGSIDVGFEPLGQGILCDIYPFINDFILHSCLIEFSVPKTQIK